MVITYKYDLKFIGIGDLTFFCGEMLLRLKKEDVLEIKINKDSLTKYRNASESYEKFCIDYVKYILSDYTVLECQTEPNRTWEINLDYINRMLSEPNVKEVFQKKFSSGKVNDDYKGHIILFTKVRAYHKSNFNDFSEVFFKHLNSLDSKIILIGERTVQYTGENGILGKDVVYSLYDEYIKNISSDKIIDLTLISNSKKIIIIGCGGFFCTSLFTEKLLSINDDLILSQFSVESNKQVFKNVNQFLEVLQNV